MKENFLIVTTPSAPNIEVEQLLGAISTNAVLGVNFFSDFMASLSDAFGGFSDTYKKKLQIIYTKAKEDLEIEARKIGANAIFDFRVDFDEISSQNKSMLMISVTGTAAKVKYPKKKKEIKIYKDGISSDQIYIEIEKNAMIERIRNKKYLPDMDSIDDIIMIDGLKDVILGNYIHLCDSQDSTEKTRAQEFAVAYFSMMDKKEATDFLYSNINKGRSRVIYLIEQCKLFSAKHILDWNENLTSQDRISLLLCDKEKYTLEDIPLMKTLRNALDVKESTRKTIEKKSLLGQSKYITLCSCGEEIDKNETYCPKCKKDEFGRTNVEGIAIRDFSRKIELIEKLLKSL